MTAYRADHVGSFLRPPELVQARGDYTEGRLGLEELRGIEDRAILDVLEMQRQVGLDVFTDGEYRRYSFMTAMVDAVEGFVPGTVGMEWRGPATVAKLGFQWMVGARLRQTHRLTGHEVPFLKKFSPGLESEGELLRRIEEAARYVPVENLALSPQCGFASSVPGNLLSRDDQRRKLELVVAVARKVWSR